MSIVYVKSWLAWPHMLIGVDLVTVCEDDAQILKVTRFDCILKDYQAVFVSNRWSRRLLEYEDG